MSVTRKKAKPSREAIEALKYQDAARPSSIFERYSTALREYVHNQIFANTQWFISDWGFNADSNQFRFVARRSFSWAPDATIRIDRVFSLADVKIADMSLKLAEIIEEVKKMEPSALRLGQLAAGKLFEAG